MEYFWKQYEDLPAGIGYGRFSTEHYLELLVIAFAIALLLHLCLRADEKKQRTVLRAVPLLMIGMELFKDAFLFSGGHFSVGYLPLHLCGLGAFVFLLFAITDRRGGSQNKGDGCSGGVRAEHAPAARNPAFWAEIAFCLILPGSIAALIYPDWAHLYPVWNFMNLYGLTWHALLVFYPLLLYFRGDAKPTIRHLHWNVLFLCCVVPPVFLFDKVFNCNYMFINWPPKGTPLEALAAWMGVPGYLVGYAIAVLVILLLFYLAVGILQHCFKKR